MKAKLVTGKFFMERVLPETAAHLERITGRRRHHDGAARGGVLSCMANLTGGCQCGAVRYEWVEKPAYSSVCYCRMCQKASGQPFMGLTGGKRRAPDVDARRAVDLPLARTWRERGFCKDCGTPLTYAFDGNRPHQRHDQQPRRSRKPCRRPSSTAPRAKSRG